MSDEHQYLDLVREILAQGTRKSDRTGTGTISRFGAMMRFDLSKGFPLLTTKRVFWRGIVEELLWLVLIVNAVVVPQLTSRIIRFISGSTSCDVLAAKGVHIWDANGSREFLDKQGLTHRAQGDLGPIYGFQWRHFGAEYVDFTTDYTGKGVDQLAQVIQTLKSNPDSRRIIMCAWNPVDVPKMALPPCHVLCQFYVLDGKLSCLLYQRSADMGLGVPFNIASYALLTMMVAHVCGLAPGDFVHSIGDAHIYINHIDPIKIQLEREVRPFPTLTIKRQVTSIDDFNADDFDLANYDPHPKIDMQMAV